MNTKERYKIACTKFLEQHPEIEAELDSLSEKDAAILCMSFDDFREWKLSEHIQRHAEYEGSDVADYVIFLSARTEAERKEMLLERHKETANALRCDWKEYCELNPHVKELVQQ